MPTANKGRLIVLAFADRLSATITVSVLPRPLLAKSEHATLALGDDCNQTAGDVGMFLPSLSIVEIRRVVGVAEQRIATTIRTVTARAVISEQINYCRGTF